MVLWFLSENILGRMTRVKSGETKSQDKYSLIVVQIAVMTGMFLGIFCGLNKFGVLSLDPIITATWGLIFLIAGIVFRWTAILTLRKYFSVYVRIREDHKVVKNGLYKYLRHPSYTGSLISFFGLGLYFRSIWSILFLMVPLFLAYLYRMNCEEKALIQALGNEYIEYTKSTKRLIPWVY